MIVGQVGGDDDQRFRTTPEPCQQCRNLVQRRVAYDDRHQCEIRAKHTLQERQMHLQAVLLSVGLIMRHHPRKVPKRVDHFPVQPDRAKGGLKRLHRR